jgi:hypothetical protein
MSSAVTNKRSALATATKGACAICGINVKVDEPHNRCYKHTSCEVPRRPERASMVYVLVKTTDKEGRTDDWETQCDSEVVGVYSSHALATKAKKSETKGMEGDEDGDTFNYGECYNTSYVIHENGVQNACDDEEGDY